MCFSPEVDFAVGAVITVVGIDAVRHCPSARYVPLAVTPLLFAAHSFSSALVWCGFLTDQPLWISTWSAWFYAVFAYVILPVLLPISILAIEWKSPRRWLLMAVSVVGAVTAFDFAMSMTRRDVIPRQCSNYVDFNVFGSGWWTGVFYVIATCGAMLLASNGLLQFWGGVNLVAVSLLGIVQNQGLPSLWCFLAAATSFVIATYLRSLPQEARTSLSG